MEEAPWVKQLKEILARASSPEHLYAELKALSPALPPALETVMTLKGLSSEFYYSTPWKALALTDLAVEIAERAEHEEAKALAWWTRANALIFLDRYQEALEAYQEARRIYQRQGRRLAEARMGVGMVAALAYMGEPEAAIALAREFEPVLKAASAFFREDKRRLGGLLNNTGVAYELLGQYEEALEAYERKRALTIEMGEAIQQARAELNIGYLLTQLNAFPEAEQALQNARNTFEEAEMWNDLVRAEFDLGVLYARWGRHQEASQAFRRAYRAAEAVKAPPTQMAELSLYHAYARLQAGDLAGDDLLPDLMEAAQIFVRFGPRFEEGIAHLLIGRYFLEKGEVAKAREYLDRASNVAQETGGVWLAYLVHRLLGTIAEATGHPEEAAHRYREAIACVETIRSRLFVESFRTAFMADKREVYEDLISLSMQRGEKQEAFAWVERLKSPVLVEFLASGIEPAGDEEAAALRRSFSRLNALYREARLHLASAGQRGELAPVLPDEIRQAIAAAETELKEDFWRWERSRKGVAHCRGARLCALPSQIQPLLDEDTVLIQYYTVRGHLWAFLLSHHSLEGPFHLGALSDIEKALRRFEADWEGFLELCAGYGSEYGRRYLKTFLDTTKQEAQTLYSLLLGPIAKALSSYPCWLISPDGLLYSVPFHALYDGNAFLVERYEILDVPGATVWASCVERQRQYEKVHRVGHPGPLIFGYTAGHLGGIQKEIEALRSLFPHTPVRMEGEATRQRWLREARDYGVIHLAAHGRFREDQPAFSYLE
ncbi:MAG TPA: tetratricopeptide repeat protein, partial [Chloroflexi bacterium]|nr:tetratricopeptide repeat protein [Chloroflexota bacterium]